MSRTSPSSGEAAAAGSPGPSHGPAALALVGLGGAVGTLARYLLGGVLPFGESVSILAINVAGSLLLGFLAALLAGRMPRLQLLLGTGFCGGFTTYSALAVGVAELARAGSAGGALALALALALGTVAAAGLATVIGLWVGAWFGPWVGLWIGGASKARGPATAFESPGTPVVTRRE